MTSVLGGIDADGAPSMGFHTYPFMVRRAPALRHNDYCVAYPRPPHATLRRPAQRHAALCLPYPEPAPRRGAPQLEYDPHSGDHGLGFFGHSLNVGAYTLRHPHLGWLCYLCALAPAAPGEAEPYTITPHDSFKVRAYVSPLGLWLVVQAGTLQSLHVDPATHTVLATLAPAPAYLHKYRVEVSAPAVASGCRHASRFAVAGAPLVRGAYEVQPSDDGGPTVVTIRYVP